MKSMQSTAVKGLIAIDVNNGRQIGVIEPLTIFVNDKAFENTSLLGINKIIEVEF
jgi:hypothetical protein